MITHPAIDAEIAATFSVMSQQRPHLTAETYAARIRADARAGLRPA